MLCGPGLHPALSPQATHSPQLGTYLPGHWGSFRRRPWALRGPRSHRPAGGVGCENVRVGLRLRCLEARRVLCEARRTPENQLSPPPSHVLGTQRVADGVGLGGLEEDQIQRTGDRRELPGGGLAGPRTTGNGFPIFKKTLLGNNFRFIELER